LAKLQLQFQLRRLHRGAIFRPHRRIFRQRVLTFKLIHHRVDLLHRRDAQDRLQHLITGDQPRHQVQMHKLGVRAFLR
jgi:hypothetical protein